MKALMHLTKKMTEGHLPAGREYYCQQCNRRTKIAIKRDHLEADEHKNGKKCCGVKHLEKILTLTSSLLKLNLPLI